MSSRVRKTTIDDKEIQIYLLRAGEGVAMAQKLGAIVANLFSDLGSKEGEEGEVEIDFAKIARNLSEQLSYEELQKMINALLKDMAINSKGIVFDDEFSGNYGFLIKILAFALKENFGSFFEGLDILGG